jgi:surface protein
MSLATGTMSTSETTNYRLRMYVDEDYNPQGDGGGLSFSVKINAYGKVKEAPTGSKMKAYMTQDDLNNYPYPSTDFHTDDYRSNVTSIITKNDNIVPKTAVASWDVSEAQDGSVMAYVEDDGSGNSTYKVTIGGKGGIIANESMIGYFEDFSAMKSIDLSALDTSEVTDMSDMFSGCSSLTNLDLSNFDTSQVTYMSLMFTSCSSLTSLDVSKFDTSKVTDMGGMFSVCSSLTNLDVSKFDTSNVTAMTNMFGNCSRLTSLDVSNFDTSKVTAMYGMFCNCPAWNTVDHTKFADANKCPM